MVNHKAHDLEGPSYHELLTLIAHPLMAFNISDVKLMPRVFDRAGMIKSLRIRSIYTQEKAGA